MQSYKFLLFRLLLGDALRRSSYNDKFHVFLGYIGIYIYILSIDIYVCVNTHCTTRHFITISDT